MPCVTLGKESFYRVPRQKHSVKMAVSVRSGKVFVMCKGSDTRQKLNLCGVLFPRHSAKAQPLSCVSPSWHSAKIPLSSPCHPRRFFLPRVDSTLGNVFTECPTKNIWQRAVYRQNRDRVNFTEDDTWQNFCRVFFSLCRVPVVLGP